MYRGVFILFFVVDLNPFFIIMTGIKANKRQKENLIRWVPVP